MRVRCFKCNTCLVSDAEIMSWYAMFINVSTSCLLSVHFDSLSLSLNHGAHSGPFHFQRSDMTVTLTHWCFHSISFQVVLPSEYKWVNLFQHNRFLCVLWGGVGQRSQGLTCRFRTHATPVAARSFRILIPQSPMRLERWRTLIGYQVGTSIGRSWLSKGDEEMNDVFFFRYWFLFEAFCASRRNSQELQILYIIRFNMTT